MAAGFFAFAAEDLVLGFLAVAVSPSEAAASLPAAPASADQPQPAAAPAQGQKPAQQMVIAVRELKIKNFDAAAIEDIAAEEF